VFSDNIFYRKQFSITHGLQFIGLFLGGGRWGGGKQKSKFKFVFLMGDERGRFSVFYINGSVHCESNLVTVQQDATVFSLLYFCRQLYMFLVLTPIIRSWYSCNYSFWHWSTGSTTIRCPRQRMVVDPVDQCQKL